MPNKLKDATLVSVNVKKYCQFPIDCDSKRIAGIGLYQAKLATPIPLGKRRYNVRLYHLVFVLGYVVLGLKSISSIGEPYRRFLEKADREGFQVMEGTTKLRAEIEHSFRDINDPNRRTQKIGWLDWMEMDIEELAQEKKRDKERNVLDSLPKHMRVPNKYAPAFWPTLLTGVWTTLHALIILLQVWSVAFHVRINFSEVNLQSIDLDSLFSGDDLPGTAGNDADIASPDGISQRTEADPSFPTPPLLEPIPSYLPTHARIIPANGSHHVLVPLQYINKLGMTLEYHRRVFVLESVDREEPIFCKVRCRTDLPPTFLDTWQGHDVETYRQAQIRYGPNVFSVRQPTFMDMYKAQLLNPLTVFQIFCVLLWAIDDYLIYSFFSLFMVLVFEATVVFQRLKSLQALRSMGNPSRAIAVYRNNQWKWTETTHLVPGDICSLTRVKPHYRKDQSDGDKNGSQSNKSAASAPKKKTTGRDIEDEGGDIVPADLLLLRGSTVVNEASLTGESVPQMKEGLTKPEETLAMKTKHKMNVVYAGTKMLQCQGVLDDDTASIDRGSSNDGSSNNIPVPPDGGCLALVLRTGFASAQGKLVRMIEGAQEKVKGHERETGLLLALLCLFAIASSSYVLYHGAQNDRRSKYELLLHCILIVTSVIRPELPMQMAMAVNNALMTLMRLHVFCTEPYRVPIAGKLDQCLFDKTGTLTTDELVAVGVVLPSKISQGTNSTTELQSLLTPMHEIHKNMAAFVIAGCHSLVMIDDETTGDPLELASLTAMQWKMSEKYSMPAVPNKLILLEGGKSVDHIQIVLRHHFSSKLQRMTCVVSSGSKKFVVSKGSSEAIGRLLQNKPDGFDDMSRRLAKEGYRVIALAYKEISKSNEDKAATWARSECEANLMFAGFIAFTCMVRKDTAAVLAKLKEGGMGVAMVTGDALLTAIHVAKEVSICEPFSESIGAGEWSETNVEIKKLLRAKRQKDVSQARTHKPIAHLETDEKNRLYWCDYEDESKVEDFVASQVPELSQRYDLATTGKSLAAALAEDDETRKVLGYIKVFARMTPDAKETVIECLHSIDMLCLMCGDGANDVGALKQADVGVALLSGFGNVNVDKVSKSEDEEKNDDPSIRAIMSQEDLDEIRSLPPKVIKMKIRQLGADPDKYPDLMEKEDLVQLYQIKARELAVKRHDQKNKRAKANMTAAELAAEGKREMAEKQRRLMERVAELEAQGVQWASFKVMQEFYREETAANQKKKGKGIEGSAASLAAQFEEIESGELPMVKLGDASIAAPFTSKMPSIRNCVDIVRQGRCTLVSSIQMYQIMALQCLISSYSLSVLYLDGVKYGDSQMTALGLLGSVSFMSVSRMKPLEKLSKVRPLTSIFHPALFLSLLLQFAIHLTTMLLAVFSAKKHIPEDFDVDLDGVFKPGILNTVVFLVSGVQQVTVFVVNLQGPPFMTGVIDNTPLLWSLIATFILTFMFASETVPGLNRYFQLVPFPDDAFRDYILTILSVNLVACFMVDRLMKLFFSPTILFASFEGTTSKDLMKLVRAFAFVGAIMYTFMGNSEQWDVLLAREQNLTGNLTDLEPPEALEEVTIPILPEPEL
ncbi:hypothetical protein ACA910_002754 [Epithemia clementina (nom. ined.)]